MLHNVTVKTSERKKLEQYWVVRALKNSDMPFNYTKTVIGERELDHEPTPDEIAQFLSDSKADFVSLVQNYRFAGELPFQGKEIERNDWSKRYVYARNLC